MKVLISGKWVNLNKVSAAQLIKALLPDFTEQEGKILKITDGVLSWAAAGSGGYDGDPETIEQDATHRFVTDEEKTTWDGKAAGDHNHDEDYQPLGDYAASSHNHDYEPLKGADDNYVTDAEKTKLSNLSGTNSGDQDLSSLVTKATTITINGDAKDLSENRAWTVSGGDIVYAPTPADVAINNVADQTIATKDLTGIAAGDQIIMEGEFIILNNSTATRVYVITLDFDNAFDIEITTPALATSATLMHPFMFRAVCNVRAANLAYCVVSLDMQLAAGIASGTDTTMAATHLSGKGWGTSASDLTGTLTCNLKIRSANNTATQTCRLVSFVIRKTSPV